MVPRLWNVHCKLSTYNLNYHPTATSLADTPVDIISHFWKLGPHCSHSDWSAWIARAETLLQRKATSSALFQSPQLRELAQGLHCNTTNCILSLFSFLAWEKALRVSFILCKFITWWAQKRAEKEQRSDPRNKMPRLSHYQTQDVWKLLSLLFHVFKRRRSSTELIKCDSQVPNLWDKQILEVGSGNLWFSGRSSVLLQTKQRPSF